MSTKITKLSIITAILFFSIYHYSDASFTISRPSTHNLGLVGHWTFDGKNVVNGVALDSSPNGNNANLINIATSTFYSIGKIGQGFNFDGTNDIASTTRINNNEITVAGWFNKTANDFGSNNSDNIFGAWYWNANTQLHEGFDLKPAHSIDQSCTGVVAGNGYLCSAFIVVTTNGTTKTQKTSLFNLSSISKNGTTTDEWFHMAGTYTQSDGNQRLYINGVLRDTDLHVAGNTVVPLATTTTGACYLKMNIGYSCVNNGYFNGKIDDVRLYNRALSGAEIAQLYNQGASKFNKTPTNILTNGLVGHWTFDGKNVVNGVALDSSPNGNNGNLINISTSTFYSIGKIGQGFNFDGTNDYINMGDAAALDFGTGDFTISAWIKTTVAKTQFIVSKRGASANVGYDFRLTSNAGTDNLGLYLRDADDVSQTVYSGTAAVFDDGNWHHAVVTVTRSGNATFYRDGVANGTASITAHSASLDTAEVFQIGASGSGGVFYGNIDEVRVYNRALSAGEVKTLYNMGR